MAWIITKDQITKKGEGGYAFGRGQWGEQGVHSGPPSTGCLPFSFRLLDDDMQIHYSGRYDAEALENDEEWGGLYLAGLWGAGFSGALHVQVKLIDYTKIVHSKGIPDRLADYFKEEAAKGPWYIPYG